MQFIQNHTPVFTERHLDHLERYRAAYGEDMFTPDAVAHERAKIASGYPSPRCGKNSICFEVFEQGEHIGDAILIFNDVGSEERCELDFSIFHEHAGQGMGKRMLREFVAFYKDQYTQPLEALVRKANPSAEHVVHLLESAGFVFEEDLGSDLVYVCTFA
ncbi:MAG: GNAT family N-acetyltransferase [Tumebacillaceae bacterium]